MRKKPVQKRSQKLAEALIEATARVVAEEGLDRLTTVRVAERAGVSVGSLYQYFEGKEALLAALTDRAMRELEQTVDRVAPALLQGDLRTIVRGLLLSAFDFAAARDGLYLELLRNWHRLDIQRPLRRFERHMMDLSTTYLMAHANDVRLDRLPARAFVIINSVVFTILRYLSLREPLVRKADLVDVLTETIVATLQRPAA